jgi:hypothetical protein
MPDNLKRVADAAPRYDVAISFVVADLALATALADRLDANGIKVFFFPRNQKELAGTNGLETLREPFSSSRLNVVLFGQRWGETPWTARATWLWSRPSS